MPLGLSKFLAHASVCFSQPLCTDQGEKVEAVQDAMLLKGWSLPAFEVHVPVWDFASGSWLLTL